MGFLCKQKGLTNAGVPNFKSLNAGFDFSGGGGGSRTHIATCVAKV